MDNYADLYMQQPFVPHEMEERNTGNPNNQESIQSLCRKYMNYHVVAQMADGSQMEGIIEDVNDQGVVMMIPEDVTEDERFIAAPGRPRRRFRRFNRFFFPFFLFIPPFIFPFPHHY
ncbi:hypothetical protein ACFP7A_10385 [Sporolactobacillus kofuensis]|uniref:Uncharacterized protein n=1 Tax=Sporolactobacillus kofuensis TaxID=269672 RepID=A0ABW1WH79_9BACL|nr:hypothetical protein [Sporolactobacillus kofuensis]MCO7176283.1 hypothetical protein [Sporolactobacillus kofuensis]